MKVELVVTRPEVAGELNLKPCALLSWFQTGGGWAGEVNKLHTGWNEGACQGGKSWMHKSVRAQPHTHTRTQWKRHCLVTGERRKRTETHKKQLEAQPGSQQTDDILQLWLPFFVLIIWLWIILGSVNTMKIHFSFNYLPKLCFENHPLGIPHVHKHCLILRVISRQRRLVT